MSRFISLCFSIIGGLLAFMGWISFFGLNDPILSFAIIIVGLWLLQPTRTAFQNWFKLKTGHSISSAQYLIGIPVFSYFILFMLQPSSKIELQPAASSLVMSASTVSSAKVAASARKPETYAQNQGSSSATFADLARDACAPFYKQMLEKRFTIKNLKHPNGESGYVTVSFNFPDSAKDLLKTDDYTIEYSCRLKSDPAPSSASLLIVSIDYNRTMGHPYLMPPRAAMKEIGKIMGSALKVDNNNGEKAFVECLKGTSNQSILPETLERYDSGYEDKNGNEFTCSRIVGRKGWWTSFNVAINTEIDWKKSVRQAN